jgi:hypothetical protein
MSNARELSEIAAAITIDSGTVTATAFAGDGSALTGITSLPDQTGNAGEFLTTDGTTASWATIATGNTTNKGMWENSNTIDADYTITTNYNAMSIGPLTVASGVTVTIPDDSNWIIL